MKKVAENIIARIPLVGKWRAVFLKHSTPGHFYSPIPDLKWVEENDARLFAMEQDLPGIDMNTEAQLALIGQLKSYVKDMPFQHEKQPGLRYFFNNIYYSYSDASTLHGMIRHFKPRRIIEVGSGYSSALMLDTNNLFMNNEVELHFIEPNPERLLSLIQPADRVHLRQEFIQDIDLSFFDQLETNDFLFIDSSHISKIGSDLNHIVFKILPRLKPGVLIHFHDVHYPFEYPRRWVYGGFAWNEAYMLRAFLMFNPHFEITLMNTYLDAFFRAQIAEEKFQTDFKDSIAGSLWLRKK